MTEITFSLSLPADVYRVLSQRAAEHRRPLAAEVALTLTTALTQGSSADERDSSLGVEALRMLDDAALQRVSRCQPTVEDEVLLDALVDARRRRGLTVEEEQQLTDLIERHDRVMVLRAEALALLKERGYDVQERVRRA